MVNIVALCSGGGGTVRTLKRLLINQNCNSGVRLEVVADRECGALEWAKAEDGVESLKIDWMNDQAELKSHIEAKIPCIVLTLIHRIIGPDLLSVAGATYINTHYSLLPSFPGSIGMKSLKRALDAGCGILGATSHKVTAKLDGGPIIAQAAFARIEGSEVEMSEIMFQCGCISTLMAIQKVTGRYDIFDEAVKMYTNEIGSDVLIGSCGENKL